MHRPIKKDANYMQNLIDYVKRNLSKGYSTDSLRWALINQGHSRIEVDKALASAQAEVSRERVASRPAASPQSTPLSSFNVEPEPKLPFWKRLFG